MSGIKRKTEENIEDGERISDILNRRIKKNRKNPYLRANGGFSLIEKFPKYKDRKKRKKRR
jgi:prolyl oligopeptidase PreP (S9A serine peptidase family)